MRHTAMTDEQKARLPQLYCEMRDLTIELESLRERAMHRIEECENDFDLDELPEAGIKELFPTLQRLVLKV